MVVHTNKFGYVINSLAAFHGSMYLININMLEF